MHICEECGTEIEVDTPTFYAKRERFSVISDAGVMPCHRCIAIVINIMTNEQLIPIEYIKGWVNSE